MLKRLNQLHRQIRTTRELRSLDRRLLDDIGLATCDASPVLDTNTLLLFHRGPFDR